MLRTHRGPQYKTRRSGGLVVFSIGGRRLAAKTEEVGGVAPWPDTMPVPSQTPFVTAIARREKDLLPVFDLAARLNVAVRGDTPLCLIARHEHGPMVIRIDSDIPSLRMVDTSAVQPIQSEDPDAIGVFQDGAERIPVYSLATLGKTRVDPRGM
ncbi:MAG: chemotaxis protein CheW [Nitrospiraceae bacterium]